MMLMQSTPNTPPQRTLFMVSLLDFGQRENVCKRNYVTTSSHSANDPIADVADTKFVSRKLPFNRTEIVAGIGP